MADFGILLNSFGEEEAKELPLYSFTDKIRKIFGKSQVGFAVETNQIYPDLLIHTIKLKNSIISLSGMKEKQLSELIKEVQGYYEKNYLTHCIASESFPNAFFEKGCIKKSIFGQYLYRSLARQILTQLFSLNKNDRFDFEIGIIPGEREEEIFSVIELLLPKIKYLTIFTEEEETLHQYTSNICSESGLSIGICPQNKGTLKEMDAIINFKNKIEPKFLHQLKAKAVLLNFADSFINSSDTEHLIINGIQVSLPDFLKNKISFLLEEEYTGLELSEMFLAHRYNLEKDIVSGHYYYEAMKILSQAFQLEGYAVKAYFGRKGLLRKIG